MTEAVTYAPSASGLGLKVKRLSATKPYGQIRQTDLAEEMGVTRSRVSQIEVSDAVRASTVERYEQALERALRKRGKR